jgi:hypothetical protein
MNSKITNDDLLRFIYQETNRQENFIILQALEDNYELREELTTLVSTVRMLDNLQFEPNDTILKIINEEASSSSFEMS